MRLALMAVLTALALGGGAAPERFEAILRNGTIVDGSGLLPYRADVAIAEGRIARIGNLSRAVADVDLDVASFYVTPGFINIHSHPQPAALARAENMLTQGVTTEILNADGSGPVDLPAQFARLGSGGLALNVGGYIGFNTVWSTVVGQSERRPTGPEIEQMRAMISAAMKNGAWGVSAGLDYKPVYFAQTAEVVAVVSSASPWRTNFNNHDRVTPETKFSSAAGIAETLQIAEGAGLLGVVTHMKVTGREQGSAADILARLTGAESRGHYAAADAYPYLAGMTGLGALIIPPWAQDGGREANPAAILRFGVEGDLRQILQHPGTSIACDCGATTATATHPRNYGSFPRVLGRYVREEKVLTWQEAVRKMTALPAATVGMVDRGYLALGMAADVTVFAPGSVIDHATYENPSALSDGIRHVFVNGVFALRDGKVTGAQGGRVLSRATGMPSRAMTLNAERRVQVTSDSAGFRIRLGVWQRPGARQARGTFNVDLPNGGGTMTATEFGVLQVAREWASFTAQAKMKPEGVVRPITVIIDRADPLAASGGAALIIDVEGARAYRAAIPPASAQG